MSDSYWKRVVALGFSGWVIIYADRAILSPALPAIQQQWAVSEELLGLIVSSFFFAYALVQIPIGVVSDHVHRRVRILVGGFLIVTIGVLCSGASSGPTMLLLSSVIMGIGQGVYYPVQFSLSTECIPRTKRAFGSSIINSGQAVGIMAGLLLAGTLVPLGAGAWRWPFFIMVIPTVLVGLAFGMGIKPRASSDKHVAAESPRLTQSESTGKPLYSLRTVGLYLINYCSNFGFFVILTWLPFYLEVKRGFQANSAGWIASLVPLTAIFGGLIVSWMSDHTRHRKVVAVGTLPLCFLALVAIPVDSTVVLVIALLVYGLIGKLALDPVLIAMVADGVEESHYGRVFGIFNFSAMTASISGPYLVGWLSAHGYGMDAGFYVAAGLIAVAAVLVSILPPPAVLGSAMPRGS